MQPLIIIMHLHSFFSSEELKALKNLLVILGINIKDN